MNSSGGIQASEAAARRLRRRYREERRFRAYGVGAILIAVLALAALLVSVGAEAFSAFTRYELRIPVTLEAAVVDPTGARDPQTISSNSAGFTQLVRGELDSRFPDAAADRNLKRQLARLISSLATKKLAHEIARHPDRIGGEVVAHVPVSDTVDLYLKGLVSKEQLARPAAAARLSLAGEGLAVDAAGGFAGPYKAVTAALSAELAVRTAAVDASTEAMNGVGARIRETETRRNDLASADMSVLRAGVEAIAAEGDPDMLAIARAAGLAAQTGRGDDLVARLSAELDRLATVAERESGDLETKAERYVQKHEEAVKAGAPNAQTRQIQARTAYLAADRRAVDAQRYREIAASLPQQPVDRQIALASLVTGAALKPLADVLVAPDAGLGRLPAALAVNAVEQAAARAQVEDAARRAELIAQRADRLRPAFPDRAEALKEAEDRMASTEARADRNLQLLVDAGERLSALAAADANAADADASAGALGEEVAGQLGLDLGGPLAAAYTLGQSDGDEADADARLRALLVAHADLDLTYAARDMERLTRKRDIDGRDMMRLQAILDYPQAPIELGEYLPSVLIEVNGGVLKVDRLSPDRAETSVLIPVASRGEVASGQWRTRVLETAEADRLVTDRQVAWVNTLAAEGDIKRVLNTSLITHSDSTYPELAGLAAALTGSAWIMLVTLVVSLPIGVMAAIYLEEFAPRNRLTDFIEVNINNLAAVPSIVFGLLGAAVFINFFGLPRSAPVVGGLVLSLLTLPTIIIATRAAIGAVPPSIREGALAVGASRAQAVFHHVLPLAAPGILTGAIIGLARALGETAPLLLIGMVAFVAEPPGDLFDSATALPVLVYKWSSSAERAWQPMTSAAIIVLLLFMFAMNALAVYLRRKLERRW
ncbi:MAG: phosphate ABC transporter permease PstA [Hyphomonadaceae bacterium]